MSDPEFAKEAAKPAYTPMCPWCGDEADDTPQEIPFFHGEIHTECAGCGKAIHILQHIDVTYTVKADPNGDEHGR